MKTFEEYLTVIRDTLENSPHLSDLECLEVSISTIEGDLIVMEAFFNWGGEMIVGQSVRDSYVMEEVMTKEEEVGLTMEMVNDIVLDVVSKQMGMKEVKES